MHGDLALAQKTNPTSNSQNQRIHVNLNILSLLFQILLLVERGAQHTPQ
jgi:hypothetical protein